MSDNNKPVHRIRLSRISASIFKNESQEGKAFYSTQFDRSYLDGEEWKHTRSFSRDDLLLLAKVADMTHSWIYQQRAGESDEPASPELE